jgi:hypothetical protein
MEGGYMGDLGKAVSIGVDIDVFLEIWVTGMRRSKGKVVGCCAFRSQNPVLLLASQNKCYIISPVCYLDSWVIEAMSEH